MKKLVVAILGTYRKAGIIDQAVDSMLASAELKGAQTKKIYLLDKQIEFCINCRICTQEEGEKRKECIFEKKDEMAEILNEIEKADSIILASPVNFYDTTALMRRFAERLLCFTYWPWKKLGPPQNRIKKFNKKAIIVASSAMPWPLAYFMTGTFKTLGLSANVLGAKVIKSFLIGFVGHEKKEILSERLLNKAKKLGEKLV